MNKEYNWFEEHKKCKESFAYFFEHYVLVDGESPSAKLVQDAKDYEMYLLELRRIGFKNLFFNWNTRRGRKYYFKTEKDE